jgi:cyclic 2,3-diphosphoglycerate synthetase
MGRGGPPEPEVITDINLTPQKLLEEAHSGKHAASDHWEDALVSRITTVGCRRCGGGLAGKVGYSNVLAGAEVVNNLDCSHVLVEGSGAAIPPVRADSYITVVGGLSPTWYFDRYFGPFRLKMADLIFVTMWEYSLIPEEEREVIKSLLNEITDVPKVYTVFRPKPVESIDGERIFVASTASQNILDEIIIPHLESQWDCQVVGASEHLSNRPLLLKDLRRDVEKATTVITELKGAAVDVVTEYALSHNKRVVYMDNQPELVEGDFSDLTSAIKHVINLAEKRFSNQV